MRRVALFATGPTADAAWQLLTSLSDVSSVRLSLDASFNAPLDVDVLWLHSDDEPPPLAADRVMSWVQRGGRLLLTQRAAARVVALGLEADGPNDTSVRTWRHAADELWSSELRSFGAYPHIRGLAGFGPHPLFGALGQGTYTWAPSEGERFPLATYARGRRPTWGRVVACERSYIHVNPDRIVAWEYAVEQGGVLCIGAFVVPGAPDSLLAPQLRALLANAITGSGIPHGTRAEPAACWPLPGRTAREDPGLAVPEGVSFAGALPGLDATLHVSTRALSDEAVIVAGRRALLVGGEIAGIREIWMHPYRVLRDLRVTIGGETPLVRDAQITPSVVQRHLVSRARIVEETATTALEFPVAIIDYRPEKIGRARGVRIAPEIALDWQVDLRRTWPYPAGANGDLRFHRAPRGTGLVVADESGLAHVAFMTSRAVEWRVQPAAVGPLIECTVRTPLEEPLRIAVLGGSSAPDFETTATALRRRGVGGLTAQRRRHETRVREELVRLRSPDEALNTAFEWAKVRLDGFCLDTPGVGRSLAAGYAATRPGWGDGRPGYGWYFGRDACWSAFALLAAGDQGSCRHVLRFLGASQDVGGKVIHEYTTSGLAHYDAADSTPLYLLLAGRYAAWTGDTAFLEECWPEIERAYRWCLGTDSDGDGLIENTRVGHGWIEMGPLSGAHVTLYLAAVWIAALDALAPLALALDRKALATELIERAARARAAVMTRFRTGDGYALGLLADGAQQPHRTALTAVPLLLGAIDPATATTWLDALASSEYSTPWGVRLLSNRDPIYNPHGYHTGAVWPLFTGWASLAEYACHRGAQGYAHLLANAFLPFARAQGCFEEVLNGDVEDAAGVCPDQAWSAAMLVSPVIEGMLGARAQAPANHLTLAPHLPPGWIDCEWRGLHVGTTTLDVRVSARPDRVVVGLRCTAGGGLGVTITPALPSGRIATAATVDNEPLVPRLVETLGCRHAELKLELRREHEIQISHRRE